MSSLKQALRQRVVPGDVMVFISALILLGVLYSNYWREAFLGNQAAIMVAGKHWLNVDLFHNQWIDVPGALGISKLQVEDGKIRFVQSPCDNKQCIHQGWIRQGGEFAACVPNKVSVQVLSADPRFDSINF
ncbi:NusG domain II-containing protein [Kaarinaea lacus]